MSLSDVSRVFAVDDGVPDDEPLVEGVPHYALRRFTLRTSPPSASDLEDPQPRQLSFLLRAFTMLPPDDAVGLLSGDDQTGLIAWDGGALLAKWAATNPLRHSHRRAAIVELGAGSGIVSVALGVSLFLQQQVKEEDHGEVRILATDANESCVSLCQRNLELNDLCGDGDKGHRRVVSATACVYEWSSSTLPLEVRSILSWASSPESSSLVILSGDVIYHRDAVAPLVHAATKMAMAYVESCRDGDVEGVKWFLQFMPRSLTPEENVSNLKQLKRQAIEKGWTVECVSSSASTTTAAAAAAESTTTVSGDAGEAAAGCLLMLALDCNRRVQP